MSLATIIQKIEHDAKIQVQEILTQAETDVKQVETSAQSKAEEEAEQVLRHAEEELHTLKNKQMATTLLQLRKERLDNRQRLLGDVFSEVLRNIRTYSEEQRKAIITSVLLSVSEERPGTLLFSKADQSLIDQNMLDDIHQQLEAKGQHALKFTFSPNTADIENGVIVDFEDFELNCSFQKVLEELWGEIEGKVSTRLFADNQ